MKKNRKPPAEQSSIRTSDGAFTTIARPHAWHLALLWLLILAAYSNSFRAPLVFDNVPVISEDPRIRQANLPTIRSIIAGQYWYNNTTSGLYRPFTSLSYMLNYAVFDNAGRPEGYHWVNLALHAVNVSLVYVLGWLILRDAALAFVLAAIWGVHPLLTESVTNIVGRADLLAAFGVLAGLLCYIRGAASEGRHRLIWAAGMVAFQTAGLFSKESAAVLPGIMLVCDLAWPQRATWRWRALAYGSLALPFAGFLYLRSASHSHLLINFPENPLIAASFWVGRLTAMKAAGTFLWLFLWPAGLSVDYSYNALPLFGSGTLWDDTSALIALTVCGSALLLAIRARRRCGPLFFFVLLFFVAMSPTSNLIVLIGSIMAERFSYLPSIGLAGCLVLGLAGLAARFSPKRQRQVLLISTGLICLSFAARTYARNLDWADGISLWSSATLVRPEAARAHNNLGYELQRIPGRLPEAIAEYQTALRIRPDYPEAHYNLGNALLRTPGRLANAVAEYRAALEGAPGYTEAHNNLGNALTGMPGGLSAAIEEYRIALRIAPDYAEAHNNLGNALMQREATLPEAVAEFQTATRIHPGYAEAHNNLGNALARIPGRLPASIAEFEAALRIRPDYAEAHNNLGSARLQIPGQLPAAIGEFEAALRIRPSYAEAHNNLGSALMQVPGRLADAIAQYEAAIESDPNLADAHYNLGNALLRVPGRLPDAIAEFEAVLRIKPDPEAQQILQRLRR